MAAAAFLKEFTNDLPWAHLDVAGTAWADEPKPWQPKGPTGVAVRTLAHAQRELERERFDMVVVAVHFDESRMFDLLRYLTDHSLLWVEEASRYTMIWLTFIGAGLAYMMVIGLLRR